MAKRSQPLPLKTVRRAKELYESGASVASILAELDISSSTLYRYVDLEGWQRAGSRATRALKSARNAVAKKTVRKPTQARPRKAPEQCSRAPAAPEAEKSPPVAVRPAARRHDALIDRLYNVAEQHVADIERRIGQTTESLSARERDGRHFASIVRMMRELAALELSSRASADAGAGEEAPTPENEDADIERIAAGYRAEFERVLDALHEKGSQQEGHHSDDSGAVAAKPHDELELPREG